MPSTDLGIPYWAGADPATLASYFQQQAEATDDAIHLRQAKKSIIAAEQTISSGLDYLGTPDRVSGIDLPANSILVVLFRALVKNSVANQGQAAIVIDDDPVTIYERTQPNPVESVTSFGQDAGEYNALTTCGYGLVAPASGGDDSVAQSAPAGPNIIGLDDLSVGTERRSGGPCYIEIPTEQLNVEVGIHFGREESGTTSAKERKLWVWTLVFD